MQLDTFYTISKADELLLGVMASEPDSAGPVKGVIQIVHGKSEHKERYIPFMEHMAKAGYSCIIHDLRGHGSSVRNPEDLGHMYGVGLEGFLSDIHQITRMAKKRWDEKLPLILFGHGMGALAVRCLLKGREKDASSVILSGSPSRNPLASPGLLFARLHGGSLRKKFDPVLKQVELFPYDKRFPGENTDYNWLCRDQEVVQAYNQDPLCGFNLTADGYEVYLSLMRHAYRRAGWKTEEPELPIFFIGGADDPYIGGPAPFHQELKCMRNLGYRNVKGRLYPGLRHEILNEAEKELVFSDIEKYLDLVLEDSSDNKE